MQSRLAIVPREQTSAAQAANDVRVTFGRLRRRLAEVGGGADLSPSQSSALARIAKQEAATASALAAVEGIRPQSMATILAGLEELGLVSRAPDPTDGRRHLVTLTAAGRARESGNKVTRDEWLVRTMRERLTEDERRTIVDAMALLDRVASP